MRAASRVPLAAAAAVALLFAIRFHAFFAGGSLNFRDAAFFFAPWREEAARIVRAGAFPYWNDATANGRALAANPNGGVFWPLSPLVLVGGTTALMLANAALLVLTFAVAARRASLGAIAAAAGAATLLLSGVFQTLPVLFTTLAAAAPLPVAVLALAGLDAARPGDARRRAALGGVALGLSILGGEPVITAQGFAAAGAIVAIRALRTPRLLVPLGLSFAIAAGIGAAQILPAAGELSRSARRADMRPEHGALFWSVAPPRVVTLLEPRLTGDPMAEDPLDWWGGATFDAGLPYFLDIALGAVPLAFALAAWRDRRGRAALLLAGGAAILSFGRFVPPLALAFRVAPVFRYPEKWWLLATVALSFAAAVGVDGLVDADGAVRRAARRAFGWSTALLAAPLLFLALLAAAAPDALRSVLFGAGLGAGPTPASRLAGTLFPLLAAGAASLLLLAVVAMRPPARAAGSGLLLALAAVLFLLDGTRRVTGTLPAGPPDLWSREPDAVRRVRTAAGGGRFYDDGADRRGIAERRARENGGFDPLRPVTGGVWGVRYAGDNDVDRMTPAARVAHSRETAVLPWGDEKVRRLRLLGATVARTEAPGPDPEGVREIGRLGGDRLVAIDGARPEFSLDGPGRIEATSLAPNRQELRVVAASPVRLFLARSFDPNWRASVDGSPASVVQTEGGLSAVDLPAGTHVVGFVYRNGLFTAGGALSLVSLAVAAALLVANRKEPA